MDMTTMISRGATLFCAMIALSINGTVTAGGDPSVPARTRRYPGPAPAAVDLGRLCSPLLIDKLPAVPAPYRPVGWGAACNPIYGPTYYHPSTKSYEGLHPTYYPFFNPRGWANYKVPTPYGRNCGSSRSQWAWDSHDDWTRGARYDQRQ